MALLQGPRLGPPSANSFKVWCKFSGAATIALQQRVFGESTWVAAATGAVDTSLLNTVVLEATGLLARTRYEYRVLEDGVQVAQNSMWTMPASDGRFVFYHVSDTHENNAATFAAVLAHWEANFEPSSVPAFVVCTGDFYIVAGATSADDAYTLTVEAAMTDMGACAQRLAQVNMMDDQDWAGNNTGVDRVVAFGGDVNEARRLREIVWRTQPQHAPPSYGFSFEVCNVPFIVADSRSGKTFRDGAASGASPQWGHDGLEDWRIGKIWDDAQATWITQKLKDYGRRSAVFFVSTTFFSDVVVRPSQSSLRDGLSLFYSKQREDVFAPAADFGYKQRPRLHVLSGDDHCCWAAYRTIARGYNPYDTRNVIPYGPNLGVPYWEWTVVSSIDFGAIMGASLGGNARGGGNVFGKQPPQLTLAGASGAVIWDVTSAGRGERVNARIRYVNILDGTTLVDGQGTVGDFAWRDGVLGAFSSSTTQHYPSDSMPGPKVRFKRGYVDDDLGTVHASDEVTRDIEHRLRRSDDVGEPGTDDLRVDEPDEAEPEIPQ